MHQNISAGKLSFQLCQTVLIAKFTEQTCTECQIYSECQFSTRDSRLIYLLMPTVMHCNRKVASTFVSYHMFDDAIAKSG